jgi:hypothetical protein
MSTSKLPVQPPASGAVLQQPRRTVQKVRSYARARADEGQREKVVSAPNVGRKCPGSQLVETKPKPRKPDVVVGNAVVYMQQCRSARRCQVALAARPPGSPTCTSEPGGQTGGGLFVRCAVIAANGVRCANVPTYVMSHTQESAIETVIHTCQAFMHKPANATNVWMLHQVP